MKKMNVCFITILFLSVFGCKKSSEAIVETTIKKVIIHSVNLDIDTAVAVDCIEFESVFEKKIKTYSIENKSTLSELELLLKNVKKSESGTRLDVRKKIIIIHNDNTIDTLCVDRFNVMIGNRIYKDNELLEFALHL